MTRRFIRGICFLAALTMLWACLPFGGIRAAKADGPGVLPGTGTNVSLTYYISNGQAAITGYERASGKTTLSIPANIAGCPVKTISDAAFRGSSELTGNLVIPSSVTAIGQGAFSECMGFHGTLTLPSGLKTIGDSAFSGCRELTGPLNLPSTLTSIGGSAFYMCEKLTGALAIPKNVKSIGNHAFVGCIGLSGTLTLPKGLASIGQYAFVNCGFTGTLTLPEGLESIGQSAFTYCGFTGKLTIPSSVTAIGADAVSYCPGFTQLTVASGNQSFVAADNVLFDKNKTKLYFGLQSKTGALTIPSSVKTICDCAFRGCTRITGELTIPSSVTSIGSYAFYGCYGFYGDLVIPNSVTSIGSYAFSGCTGFSGTLTIPDSITDIESGAFNWCEGFMGLKLPNGLLSIGDNAFSSCTRFGGLEDSLEIPASVTSIGRQAFLNCNINEFVFRGNAPTVAAYHLDAVTGTNDGSFDNVQLRYDPAKTGWSTPTWLGYQCSPEDEGGGYTPTESGKLREKYLKHIQMKYPKKLLGVFVDDKTYPPIPKMDKGDFAAELQNWAQQLGYAEALRGADYKQLLTYQIYMPAEDAVNGQPLLVDDGSDCSVQTMMAYLAFMVTLREGYINGTNELLKQASIYGSNTDYEKWYDVLIKYYERYVEFQSDVKGDYLSLFGRLAAIKALKSGLKHYGEQYGIKLPSEVTTLIPKVVFDKQDARYASNMEKFLWYATIEEDSTFRRGLQDGLKIFDFLADGASFTWKAIQTNGKSITGTKIFKLGLDYGSKFLLATDVPWLNTVGKIAKEGKSAMTLMELTYNSPFLGPVAIAAKLSLTYVEQLKKLLNAGRESQAGWYLLTNYYLRTKFPAAFDRMFNQDTLEPWRAATDPWLEHSNPGITGDKLADKLIQSYQSFFYPSGSTLGKNYVLDAKQEAELLSASYLFERCSQIDYESLMDSMMKCIVEQYRYQNKPMYRMEFACPVSVHIYDGNRNLTHSISSLDGRNVQNFDANGSYYLSGANAEIKTITLNAPTFWAEIVPYDAGTMDVVISQTQGNAVLSSEKYSGVQLIRGQRLAVNNATGDLPALYVLNDRYQAIHTIAADGRPALYTVLVEDNGNAYQQVSAGKVFQGAGEYQFTTGALVFLGKTAIGPDANGVYHVAVDQDVTVTLLGAGAAGEAAEAPNTGDNTPLAQLAATVLLAGIALAHRNARRRNGLR